MERTIVKLPRGPANIRVGIYYGLCAVIVVGCFSTIMHFAVAPKVDWWFLTLTVVPIGVTLILHFAWLRKMNQGRAWAVVLGYILYAPILLVGFTAIVFFSPVATILGQGVLGRRILLGSSIFFAVIILFLLVVNVFSPELWKWLRMNGRCPLCGQGRFKTVKPGTSFQCPECSGELRFEWVE